jgi:hypothetical protein
MSNVSVDDVTPGNDTEDEDMTLRGSVAVPVGITIAYKRQEQGFTEEKMSSGPGTTGSSSRKKRPASLKKQKKGRTKSRSFQMLLESAAIYTMCLILPTLLAYFYSMYDAWSYKRETGAALPVEDSFWYVYVVSSPNYQWLSETFYQPIVDYVVDSSSYQWLSRSLYEPILRYVCIDAHDTSKSSYVWSVLTSAMLRTGMCPLSQVDELAERSRSVLSDDVSAYTDAFTIAVCSFVLAFIRIAIIRVAVPIEDSDTLEAMVRCKSVHLLSSDYVLTPIATPRKFKSLSAQGDAAFPALPSLLPNLNESIGDGVSQDELDNSEMFGYNIDGNSEREADPPVRMQAFAVGAPALAETLAGQAKRAQHEPKDPGSPDLLMNVSHDESEDERFSAALLQSLTAAAAEDEGMTPRSRNRLYAAPRYATALFRLLYSTAAAGLALLYFREADFWPWFVFGHGQTEKCWDLSGGLTVGMDSDFDQRNAVLKRYFLWQASYHWHSGAFHVLSLLILLLHPTKHAPRRLLSFRKGSKAYLRSLFQHVLAVALIAAAYIFSSLRRLGAIGLFAFDVSSWFLHLLQVCINAPEESRFRCSAVISRIYWVLVIPSFAFTRFFVWPAIWYSAAFESKTWLLQLERTLWPGSAALLRNVFHCLMVVMHAMSVIYFRRLWNHPHLHRILRQHLSQVE